MSAGHKENAEVETGASTFADDAAAGVTILRLINESPPLSLTPTVRPLAKRPQLKTVRGRRRRGSRDFRREVLNEPNSIPRFNFLSVDDLHRLEHGDDEVRRGDGDDGDDDDDGSKCVHQRWRHRTSSMTMTPRCLLTVTARHASMSEAATNSSRLADRAPAAGDC